MTGSLRYAVVVERPSDFKPVALADALAAWKRVPAADTILAARRCWGVAARGEEKARAEALADILRSRGIAALALPDNLVEEPPPASLAQKLEPAISKRIALLAAAAFKKTTTREVKTTEGPTPAQRAVKLGLMMTGLPVGGFGGGAREVVKKVEETDLVFYVDLVLREPAERVRVDAQDFDFSCLGARKAYGTIVNFRTLIEWLSDLAPSASRGRGTRCLLEGKPVREMGYESLEDLDAEVRWLLTLKALGKL